MYKITNIKELFLILLVTLLMGCQTAIELASSEHKLVGEKWYALSGYADSYLVFFDLTVSASLTSTSSGGIKGLKLSDFKLSKSVDRNSLDLLFPKFEYKYICTPVCMQLIEYDRVSGQTVLSTYFEKHEFELFKFYGDIYILNKQIEVLNKNYNGYLAIYLNWLNDQNYSFDSLKDFINFLSNSLKMSEMDKFISDPSKLYDSKISIKSHISPEMDWLAQDIPPPEMNWLAPDINIANNIPMFDDKAIHVKQDFTSIKQLSIGKIVCSYSDNYFGVVLSFDEEKAKILVKGQGKMINDGIVTELEAGSLLYDNLDYLFTPLHEKMLLAKKDLFPCEIEL